jgi:putative ABC transport system permease protein
LFLIKKAKLKFTMRTFFTITGVLAESFRQAVQQLWGNKLRTMLSLLGVTIGIWCVIMVFSAVDSLEANIQNSFDELGDDVVYISTMPWGQDPRENLWKYERRPEPNRSDYMAIRSQSKSALLSTYTIFLGNTKADYTTSEADNVFMLACTEDYKDVFGLQFEYGRYFSDNEFFHGANKVVLGWSVAATLFKPNQNPIGEMVRIKGQSLEVIGVLKKEGKDLLNPINFDNAAIITNVTSSQFIQVSKNSANKGRTSINVKARKDVSLDQLKNELTGILRAHRKIRPSEENNFELNTLSILSGILTNIFGVIRIAGFVIGIFAIIVGGFSVANIMFVSVKERTHLIGVKKALGAKQLVILTEFLVEAVLLCLVGGFIGLGLVYLATLAITALADFPIFLDINNMLMGLFISTLTGVVAGIIPAYRAAGLDPVEAMRA